MVDKIETTECLRESIGVAWGLGATAPGAKKMWGLKISGKTQNV